MNFKNIKTIYMNKIKKFLSGNLMKNIALVTGGTAMGQAINTLASPIVTRLYSPSEYGVLSVFSSLLLVFSFSSLKYELAIPIAKTDKEATNIFSVSVTVLTTFSFVMTILLLFFGDSILNIFNANALIAFKFFIPLGVFFNGLNIILKQWMFREKNFKQISQKNIQQNLVGNVLKVIFGFLKLGGGGLIIGRIVSTSYGSLSFYKNSTLSLKGILSIRRRDFYDILVKYKDFPLFQATSTALVHLRNQFPILMLAPIYGTEVVGLFGLANTIVKIPMTLVGQSVMDVFYAEIASIGKEQPKKILKISDELLTKLIIIGIIPTIILMLIGPQLFALIFGANWIEAGVFAQLLSISILANLVFSPISKIYEVFRRQGTKFLIDLFSLLIIVFIFWMAETAGFPVRITILIYSVSMAIVYFTTYIISREILKNEIKKR